MCDKAPGPKCADHMLEAIIHRYGFERPHNKGGAALHRNLITTEQGLWALKSVIDETTNPLERTLLVNVYRYGYQTWKSAMEAIGKTPSPYQVTPDEAPYNEGAITSEEVISTAMLLYVKESTPLHGIALRYVEERLMKKGIRGYSGGVFSAVRLDTKTLCKRMNINYDSIPNTGIAVDIETDTALGYGLSPQSSQITEIVIASKAETLILSGDEKEILRRFTNYLNTRREALVIYGWNTYGFDNPFMDIRARLHKTVGWYGKLTDSYEPTRHEPVGGYKNGQSMSWLTPQGIMHTDVDVAQLADISPLYQGGGLKPSVRALGV